MESFIDCSEKLLSNFTSTDYLSECANHLQNFINKNEKSFTFSHISKDQHHVFTTTLFDVINKLSSSETSSENFEIQSDVVLKCLTILRILSRDKIFVDSISCINEALDIFMKILNYSNDESKFQTAHRIETLKCLCNWTYHNATVRRYFKKHDITVLMLKRIEKDGSLSDILFYEIRLLFVMTAFENEQRSLLLDNSMLPLLTKVLKNAVQTLHPESEDGSVEDHKLTLHENIMGEILKALFNVTLQLPDKSSIEMTNDCSTFVSVLREMLVKFHSPCFDDLLTHIAHMLVNIPKKALYELIIKKEKTTMDPYNDDETNEVESDIKELDMSVIDILLDALVVRMQIKDYNAMKEKSMAILTTFSYMSRINRDMRKYLRSKILLPYKPSETRPEEFEDTRGMIVKLMTTIDVPLKNMAADFLFVLCKENTDRLIRYAGYGNSAGYLASRGLMIPGMVHAEGDYSEDELTDVEDGDINVMTGARDQHAAQDNMEMTEEEKEIEAEKLMCMMDRLTQLNVIKPMQVTADGKLTEIQPSNKNNNDSDGSDDY